MLARRRRIWVDHDLHVRFRVHNDLSCRHHDICAPDFDHDHRPIDHDDNNNGFDHHYHSLDYDNVDHRTVGRGAIDR